MAGSDTRSGGSTMSAEGPVAGENAYQPPPTPRDEDMSRVHHESSLRYNLTHARAHADEALNHVRALKDRLQASPRFDTHYRGLGEGSPAEEADETPAEEHAEQRALRRGGSPRRADRMARRSE